MALPRFGDLEGLASRGDAGPSLMSATLPNMNQSAFYAVVSTINFTLLGLWWVAVKDRADLVGATARSRRTAYLVSLQFVIPGTVSLLAQVAPDVTLVWRVAFGVAGIVGAIGIVMLSSEIRRTSDARLAPVLFLILGVPVYALVILVAVSIDITAMLSPDLKPIQVEAFLVTLLVFLGVQEAWVVSMTPSRGGTSAIGPSGRTDFAEDGLGPLPPE